MAIDVNPHTPGDELVVHYLNQIDVLNNVSLTHQKSFIIPTDRKYSVTPLPGTAPDSLRFLFSYTTPTTATFDLYLYHRDRLSLIKEKVLFFTGQDRDQNGELHQSLETLNEVFVNRDHRQMVILRINSGGDGGTRGVVALDPLTAKVMWQYSTGPQVCDPIITDLNSDGSSKIVFGSYAPSNGVVLNGTRDDSCSVFVLDDQGNERWRKTIGPYFSGVVPITGDMTGDGKKELVVYCFGSNPNFDNYDVLIQLDVSNGAEIQRKKLGSPFTASMETFDLCHDFDGDGVEEFVIGSRDGFVRIYRGDFSIMYTSEPYRRAITVYGIRDLDGDGLLEVACLTADKQLVILNHQLKHLLMKPLTPNFDALSLIKLPNKTQILFKERSVAGECDFQLSDFHAIGVLGIARKHAQPYATIFLFFSTVAIALFIGRHILYGRRAEQLLRTVLQQTNSLDRAFIVKRKNNILWLGRDWIELLQMTPGQPQGQEWPDIFPNPMHQPVIDALNRMREQNVTSHNLLFKNSAGATIPLQITMSFISWVNAHCFMIFDLREEEHIRQVKHWAQVAQRLAHGIKNPLTTVKLNAEELLHTIETKEQVPVNDVAEFIQPIINQVTKLKKMSDGFMHFVEFEQPDLKPIDINRELMELIPQWMPEKTDRIQIQWELEENLPPAHADIRQFEYALKNVFYNALESIRDKGKIIITTRTVRLFANDTNSTTLLNFIELEIRDTGCGIPQEFMDRIKQPYFSYNKPEGTGLGLSIVQKIMDSHGGQFDVLSDIDMGTTVLLRFKLARPV